jgi:hypothetical protein
MTTTRATVRRVSMSEADIRHRNSGPRFPRWGLWVYFQDRDFQTYCRFNTQEDAELYACQQLIEVPETVKFGVLYRRPGKRILVRTITREDFCQVFFTPEESLQACAKFIAKHNCSFNGMTKVALAERYCCRVYHARGKGFYRIIVNQQNKQQKGKCDPTNHH